MIDHARERRRPRPIAAMIAATMLAFAMLLLSTPDAHARPFHFVTHNRDRYDYWPRWSPDGKTILFSRLQVPGSGHIISSFGPWRLFTVPSRGGRPTEFVSIAGIDATRSNWLWTSDPSITTPIAFSGLDESGDASGIYVVGPGQPPTLLPTDNSIPNGYPSWFPDGSALTVEGQVGDSAGPSIDLVSVPGGTLLQKQTSPDQIWTGESAISRDGTMLAFAGQQPQTGSVYDDDQNQIWIQKLIPPDTDLAGFDTGLHQLDPLQGRTPDWSPNDRFLIFESKRGCPNGNYAIFIEAADTGKAIQVTDCRLNANHAVWAPDGRRFAFSAEFLSPPKSCSFGCRGIAIAPVPAKILRLGTAN